MPYSARKRSSTLVTMFTEHAYFIIHNNNLFHNHVLREIHRLTFIHYKHSMCCQNSAIECFADHVEGNFYFYALGCTYAWNDPGTRKGCAGILTLEIHVAK